MLTALLSLTLTAAPAPAFAPKNRPYDALHYTLDVKLAADGTYRNRLTATIKPTKATSEIEFDAYDLTVELALVDGKAATPTPKYDPATKTGVLVIKSPKPLPAGKDVTVEVAYAGKAGTSNEGFFAVQNEGAAPWFFTHFEPFYAQRFFPCNDQPADKATFDLNVVVDEKYVVLSNGRKERDEKFTEDGKNLRRVTWKQEKPHSTYLVALAVGQFDSVEASPDVPATI
ncbi:MAG: hypothetical protein JNG84_08110, partial [Archangium sp.]|nr:hypothetical protein [Archangium sp.]